MKNKFLLLSIVLSLFILCIAEATSYKNNLIYYVAKQKNKIPRRYISPTDTQIDLLREAVYFILQKDFAGATRAANSAGYKLNAKEHTNDSTYYRLESADSKYRPWGTYVFYLGDDKTDYIIEVPHPMEEKNTCTIGIKAFIDSKATAFLLSGSRKSAGDVTLNANSIFQAVHEEVAKSADTVVIQIHGFNNRKYPQIVLTSGTPVSISAMDSLVDELIEEDLEVGIYDGIQYTDYGATQNEQAKYTNSIGGSFIGIYLNQAIHHSKKKNTLVIDAIEEYTVTETTTTETPTS